MENWLCDFEKDAVIETLVNHGLVAFDNKRKLPLKKGGTTDIYIALRNARNHPEMLHYLAERYASPLYRLGVNRFIEIPDSVSCFAGPLAIETDLPYVTIRGESKEGRVSNPKMIGEIKRGDYIAIIDDVITDGASKLPAIRMCGDLGAKGTILVVLVDRQQGWQKKFQEHGIEQNVWAGMTLHDVRKFLIERGVMERCNPEIEKNNPMIVAYDGKDWDEILPTLDELRTTGCIIKVNDLLFYEGIKNLVPDLQVYGRVMVDIKGYDIPNTLENISRRILPFDPWAVTVHASGGSKMLSAVSKMFEGSKTKVLAVTVLTSFNEKTCEAVYNRLPADQVNLLADIAWAHGVSGFVCSPEEARVLKARYPEATIVTPGIRSEGVDQGDQERISTPAGALENGADYIVMGRQITGSTSPSEEAIRVLKEELRRM